MNPITNLDDYRELRKYRRIADKLAEEQSRLPVYQVEELDAPATERAIREMTRHMKNIQFIEEFFGGLDGPEEL